MSVKLKTISLNKARRNDSLRFWFHFLPGILLNYLLIGSAITLTTACRITYIDDNDGSEQLRFSTELAIKDVFDQPTNVFNSSEEVVLQVVITNLTDNTQTLEFDTSQHFDFYVADSNVNPVWDWSNDQVFTTGSTELIFNPNQRVTFEATWDQRSNPGQPINIGEYSVQALIPVLGEGLNRHLSQQPSEFRTDISPLIIQ